MYRSVCFACAVRSGARVEQGAWSGDARVAGAIVVGAARRLEGVRGLLRFTA